MQFFDHNFFLKNWADISALLNVFVAKNWNEVINSIIFLFTGGTGITPMLQLINQVTLCASDNTKVALLFANQTEEDILLRSELEAAKNMFPEKVKLWYTVDRPQDG